MIRAARIPRVHKLSGELIEEKLRVFLSDDSEGNECSRILATEQYRPVSFTVGDPFLGPLQTYGSDTTDVIYLRQLVSEELNRICESESMEVCDPESAVWGIIENLLKLLEYRLDDGKLADTIWNQEFIDVLHRVMAFSLVGDPGVCLRTHRRFNGLADRIIPHVIERIHAAKLGLSTSIRLCIISGISGLDLKGSGSASSQFSQTGIRMSPYFDMSSDRASKEYFTELMSRLDCPVPVFHWERFIRDVSDDARDVNIAWLTDDYIETIFDLHFAELLMTRYPRLKLTLIPKNGIHGNDASWSDVMNFLKSGLFPELSRRLGREFRVCGAGPRMGAVNLRKLSTEVVDIISRSDFVVVKGCRSHELIQGGLDKPSFTMHTVSRETTEMITGFSADESPLLLFYLRAGEFAYRDLDVASLRKKNLAGHREIVVCGTTVEEHFRLDTAAHTGAIDEVSCTAASKGSQSGREVAGSGSRIAKCAHCR
ncbi:MAG: ARMT1-like domain-containing protein [Candidatus Zixiibacteriota bacterium]